ncbi:MAG: DEAD/DEAH box helicase, partial [Chloroflexi bacterium]|nr:DEAD/DEAH box helicase [Chloroflexota bacterium]
MTPPDHKKQADVLAGFHPAVARWFRSHFPEPTAPQERGWPAIRSGKDTLIASPTGTGKTLAAFLTCIDDLVRQGLAGALADETQVLYVSPLKALSNDIQKNLSEPLREVRDILTDMGLPAPDIRVLVRTGDTPASQRQAMTRRPPHILVTTPESLYILLTSNGGRSMLKTVRTVIVDEIHAVARDRRGAHLALSLERLTALLGRRPTRIGLSATQQPIEEVARFLVGTGRVAQDGRPRCTIVDEGHVRRLDLALELPSEPMASVMSNETWEEVYDRLAELIKEHRTTLVFTNTRRLAERVSLHLAKRLGEGLVTSHHGSLSREQRLNAEQRLKAGDLRALVATASLELGIDIGTVDLVCQLGSTRAISTFLQRVGRSGHTPSASSREAKGAVPKGRLFPFSRDDLVECAALMSAVRQGKLDRLSIPEKPLDILAQQIVAAVAVEEWGEDELFDLFRNAYPFRNLSREAYDQVVAMLAEGFASRRGRSGAHIHYDGVGRKLRARRGARLAAITSGGAIPETADYQVVLEPHGAVVGTLNEDFAIESMPGDIFQLGISSWRILRVEQGKVRVEDAHGQPPTIPFWLGEAPARTAELSAHVSDLRKAIEARLADPAGAVRWLTDELRLDLSAAEQIVEYLAATKASLGVVPTQETIVLERFFDDSGGMQLVLHAPFGGRINRAWGLALRKRFCRMFNQELQAAATEDGIVISLGPQHSFPLADVFDYLKPHSTEQVLVQALLAAPMFQMRWRWNVTRSLAVLRREKGKKVPAPFQRMRADDLLGAVFPTQVACAENVAGDIEIPDHPLVTQTVHDCLHEAMDVDGLIRVLDSIEQGLLNLVAKETVEPSPLACEILNVKPYAFLDDAPLEERRTQAVMTRRVLDVESARDLATLDAGAIALVKEQAWPDPENEDELHDALSLLGYMTEEEAGGWGGLLDALAGSRRATLLSAEAGTRLWVAAERLPQLQALFPGASLAPAIVAPPRDAARVWERGEALHELLRGRLEGLGPVTAVTLASSLALPVPEIESALAALEAEGFVFRGHFSPGVDQEEWCERRLLARIHRHTLDRLRKEIEPATASEFLRFVAVWQHADPEARLQGTSGVAEVLDQLQGFQAPAGAWEAQVLPARIARYAPSLLDELCLSGQVVWGRLFSPANGDRKRSRPTRSSPVALLFRQQLEQWLGAASEVNGSAHNGKLSSLAREIEAHLQRRGACFLQDLARATRRLPAEVRNALGELVAAGLITGDGFAGLRGLIAPARRASSRRPRGRYGGRFEGAVPQVAMGRWSLLRDQEQASADPSDAAELWARQLLRRYGIIFHRLALRETGLPPWRDILRALRRLEARGEIRGGRFVSGFSGEQYALPEAVVSLRAVRRKAPDGHLVGVSGADPLNLVGILTPGDRVPAVAANRIVYRDGVPIAARVAGAVTYYPSGPDRRSE